MTLYHNDNRKYNSIAASSSDILLQILKVPPKSSWGLHCNPPQAKQQEPKPFSIPRGCFPVAPIAEIQVRAQANPAVWVDNCDVYSQPTNLTVTLITTMHHREYKLSHPSHQYASPDPLFLFLLLINHLYFPCPPIYLGSSAMNEPELQL